MADVIVTQDPTNPGVNKLNGPPIVNGKVPYTSLETTGAAPNDVMTFSGGQWQAIAASGVESASNLGGGAGVFSSKVGTDFQFKSLVAGTGITITPSGTEITISASGGISSSFTSSDQTITSAGALTIAHGLGAVPKIALIKLKCTTGENGYSIGDEVFLPIHQAQSGADCGVALTADATNVYIRYGNTATAFIGLNKTTGVYTTFTNANWKFIVRVFA